MVVGNLLSFQLNDAPVFLFQETYRIYVTSSQMIKWIKNTMLFILYYIIAITILVLHFTGYLARRNMEWVVLVLAVTVFPAVLYL